MLYARFGKKNSLECCFGANVSRIAFGKKVILDATETTVKTSFETTFK
jgi:hypothetical protein